MEDLRGASFRLAQYETPSEEWDHDHCRGCWAKFAEYEAAGILHEGYVYAAPVVATPEPEFIRASRDRGMRVVPQPAADGSLARWVCPRCFQDFRGELGFVLESD